MDAEISIPWRTPNIEDPASRTHRKYDPAYVCIHFNRVELKFYLQARQIAYTGRERRLETNIAGTQCRLQSETGDRYRIDCNSYDRNKIG